MVHFTQYGFAALFYSGTQCRALTLRVTPFGCPGISGCLLLPPGFSQLTTAFFASQLPGIRHKPVLRLTILLFLLRHTYVCLLFPFPNPVKYRS